MCDAFGLEVTVAMGRGGGGWGHRCVHQLRIVLKTWMGVEGGVRGAERGPAWEEVAPSAGCGAINTKE